MNVSNFDGDPNIKGTLAHYLETAIPLTAVTIWIIIASQTNVPGMSRHERGWQNLAWPFYVLMSIPRMSRKIWRGEFNDDTDVDEDRTDTSLRV